MYLWIPLKNIAKIIRKIKKINRKISQEDKTLRELNLILILRLPSH